MSQERADHAWDIVMEDMKNIRQARRDNLPQLTEQMNDADPFLIRTFTGSRQFKNMKDSLRAYSRMNDLADHGTLTLRERVDQMKRAAEQLQRYANTYLEYKHGEGRNPNERRRVEAATAVYNFARRQLQSLTQMEGHLEDMEDARRELLEEEGRKAEEAFRNYVNPVPERNVEVEKNAEAEQKAEPEKNVEPEQKAEPEKNVEAEQKAEPEKNVEPEQGIEQEENLENEELEQNNEQDDDMMDEAELEKLYKDTFCVNGKQAMEGGFTDFNSCIKYILRELRNLFLPDEKTYEHLGLSGKHDSEEPLSPEAKKTAEKLMKYMTTREVLYKEQEQRQAEEREEPSLIEIMSAEMEPEEFMTLVTSTPSFQSALENMTCAGIYDLAADEYSADLKKLAGKVRAEMPQTARQYLYDLGEPSKTKAKEPVNNTQKENEVKVCQGPR